MADKKYPTKEALSKLFGYLPEPGLLYWLPRQGDTRSDNIFNSLFAGKIAGDPANRKPISRGNRPTVCMNVNGVRVTYSCHKIIWILHHGEIPKGGIIDHRDGDAGNNRIGNLRIANKYQNAQNSKKRKGNVHGSLGVSRLTRRTRSYGWWVARFQVNNKQIHLGQFPDIKDAIAARREAEIKYFGEYAPCLSRPV